MEEILKTLRRWKLEWRLYRQDGELLPRDWRELFALRAAHSKTSPNK